MYPSLSYEYWWSVAMAGTLLTQRCCADHVLAGVILLMASAGGLFPMPIAPVYAASKVLR